ncbi:hypothetical protein FRC09_014036 [Ceratobasidium sp. 395]|nr:hypothetical protein FRC09_014036 [Ceratobasidium sp. 395]
MSRQGSVSLHSLDSPPSQSHLAFPLVAQSSSSMHDPHASAGQHAPFDFQSSRYSVDPYGVVPGSAAASPPLDYAMHSPMSATHTIGGHGVGAVRPKRKQVKNACSACQRACKRCDVGRPCERCIKYGMQESCRDSQRKERKKGVKRGPYKKRDGESALPVPPPRSVADVAPPGMLNELQRMNNMPTKTRTSRVSSISEPQSQASTSQMDPSASAAVPLYIQSVPSARPSEGPFPYSTAVMIPAPTQHPSLASMHSSSSHASMHHSTRSEDQYYQPRYDHLGSSRSAHFRVDSYSAQQDYQSKQVPQMVDHRSMRALHYPSSGDSPPRERQYSGQMYNDNRHAMIQASTADVSYQSQSEPAHDSPRTIDAQYSYPNQQHQRPYERNYQDRSYASEGHMQDTQQEIQQSQQQQYYPPYNAYPSQSSSGYTSYGYSQNHASHAMAPTQHVPDQADPGYMNRTASDQVSYGSSINSYPTQQQQQQPYSSQHSSQGSMPGGVQYAMRSAGRMMHRDVVAHPHVGNVQIQSN